MKRYLAFALSFVLFFSVPFAVRSEALVEMQSVDNTVIETDEDARTLVLNDMGQDVKDLQTHLAELGYYTGQISGRYGESTQAAVLAFQKDFQDYGLEDTGKAEELMADMLEIYDAGQSIRRPCSRENCIA